MKNALPGGGFSISTNKDFRPDATAWAVIAFSNLHINNATIDLSLKRLGRNQLSDGRVPLQKNHPQACWPTPLAIIAWHDKEYQDNQNKAVKFILEFSGLHWKKNNLITGHDTLIKGWPWIEHTHSWVEPTSMAMMALELSGKNNHPRVEEAKNMLLDRQLDNGGWNYGNTSVFHQELLPMPESTGMALCALDKKIEKKAIKHSLEYLQNNIEELKTPLSLSWGLLGLAAWGIVPEKKFSLITACLKLQKIYGDFPTDHLSLLLIALVTEKGFVNHESG